MKSLKYVLLGLYGVIGMLISVFGPFKLPFAETLAKEHYRYAIGGVLIILLILPVAIGVFLLSFDANSFKSEIVQYVKEHSQRDLVLQGDIKVTFFPKLGLDSGRMSLSQRNSAREFAAVNNARLYIAWLPLLKKQLVFDHIEIDGARVNLSRFKDGTTNYDDLLIRDETLSPLTFDIDSVHITNSSLNWQDEMKWQRIALQDVQIETGRLADTVPGNLKASFHLNSEMAHSDSSIELRSRLFYDRKAGRYEFADIEGTLAGTAAGFSNLDLSFKGSVDSHSLPDSSGQELLQVENIAVAATGNYGQRSIDAKLGVPRLQLAKGMLSGSQATLDATLSQFDEKWTTAIQMPAFEVADKIFKAESFNANFDFKGDGGVLQGKLSGPVSIDLGASRKLQFSPVALNFSATHPVLSGELSATATGSVNADFSERNANVDFKAKIDDSQITGTLALSDFSHPAYTFDISTSHLDLDRYIAAGWIKRYQDDTTQLDLGFLKNLTLSGRLHADQFNAAKLKATKLATEIRVEHDTLTIAPLTAKLYGGTWAGSFSVAAQSAPQIVLRQNLKGIQMGALLAATSSTGRLAGKGDVALDLSAEGSNIGVLRKTVSGNVTLALARGSLAGIDLRAALLAGKDDLGTKSEARVHEAKFNDRTDFSELKAAFNIKEGKSSGNSFEMRSPLFRVGGEGDLAFDSGSVNYPLAVVIASVLKRQTAGSFAELKGVTVPLRVSGAWAAPSMALDFAAASGGIVTKRIAAKAAAEVAAAKEAQQAAAKRSAPAKKRLAKAIKK